MAMPFVNLTQKLQVVGRYTFSRDSRDPNGIELATYEDCVVSIAAITTKTHFRRELLLTVISSNYRVVFSSPLRR